MSTEPVDANASTDRINKEEVKITVKNVLSQYLEDEDGEGGMKAYNHNDAQLWIDCICKAILDKLKVLGKPFKYIVSVVIMRRTGAGIHVTSSAYYSQQLDGYVCEAHDISKWIYCVATVYWVSL